MLLWAQPGFGKTTIVKKLAFDWATLVESNDETTPTSDYAALLSQVDLLFVFPLRSHQGGPCAKLTDLILQPPVVSKTDAKFIKKWLRTKENRSSVLAVLDGFDELAKPDICAELHAILFDRKKLPSIPLLVTSRPHAVQHAQLRSAQVTGIAESDMKRFVEKYCGRADGEELLRCLRRSVASTPVLKSMFTSPLLLQLLCSLFSKLHTLPRRQTELYEEMFVWMVEKDREKRVLADREKQLFENPKKQDLPEANVRCDFVTVVQEHSVIKLSCFAFRNIVTDEVKLIFERAELENREVNIAEATRIGFVVDGSLCASAEWPVNTDGASAPQLLSFSHASVQEFLAALFAAKNVPLFEKALQAMKHKHRLREQFLVFFCGLCDASRNDAAVASEAVRACLQEKFEFEDSFERQVMLSAEFDFDGIAFSLALFFDFVVLLQNESVSQRIRTDALTPLLQRIRDERYGMPLLAFVHNPAHFVDTQHLVRGGEIYQSVAIATFSVSETTHFCIAEFVYSKVDRALCVVQLGNLSSVENVGRTVEQVDRFSNNYGHVSAFRFRGSASAFVAFASRCNFTTHNVQLFFDAKFSSEPSENTGGSPGLEIERDGYLTLYLHDRDLNREEARSVSRLLKFSDLDLIGVYCQWPKSPGYIDAVGVDSEDRPLEMGTTRRMCIANATFAHLKASPSLRMLLRCSPPRELQLTTCEISSDDFLRCGFPSRIQLLDCVAIDAASLSEVASIAATTDIKFLIVTFCALSSAERVRSILLELSRGTTSPLLQFCECALAPECEEAIRRFQYRGGIWLDGKKIS